MDSRDRDFLIVFSSVTIMFGLLLLIGGLIGDYYFNNNWDMFCIKEVNGTYDLSNTKSFHEKHNLTQAEYDRKSMSFAWNRIVCVGLERSSGLR